MKINTQLIRVGALAAAYAAIAAAGTFIGTSAPFERISTFYAFENASIDDEAVAEIVAASEDGMTLVYTDGEAEALGFVDITDPSNPLPGGLVALNGEPTSVAVAGPYALVAVNTSLDFVQTSGELVVIDIATQTIERTLPLGGQPDCIAVSPDRQYAAIAIENERDEDLLTGEPPQLPAGFLVIVDLIGPDPAQWATRSVDLVGVPDLYPDDPEPEYIDINRFNVAAVTMQENNHIALVALASGEVLIDFPAGTADLTDIDTNEDDLILQSSSLTDVPREPDAVTWVTPLTLATADEGDLFGGSRGFTIFQPFGGTLYEAGNTVEHIAASLGHYPENRSENKGTEPEGVEVGVYDDRRLLFVGAERANIVLVYEVETGGPFGNVEPRLIQALPTGVGPEGLLAIPSRDLFVVASEVDDRGDKLRSSLMIFERTGTGSYPSLQSVPRPGDTVPIPWGALSGLTSEPGNDARMFAVADSFYGRSSVLTVDRSMTPARIVASRPLVDRTAVLATLLRRTAAAVPGADVASLADRLNGDGTVNLDLEGIAATASGFWAVSEGSGELSGGVSSGSEPFEAPNVLLELAPSASGDELDIVRAIGLPMDVMENQRRFGLEGVVAASDGAVYVAFQRAWEDAGDPSNRARIGRFDPLTGAWSFAYYPLDTPTSANGGWVGLSEISEVAPGTLAVLERDNQGGPDAAIKRIYTVDLASARFVAPGAGSISILRKTLANDLLLSGALASFGGFIPEKLEGMTVLSNGDVLVVNDNDGVDDSSGETRIVHLPTLFP